MAVSVVNAMNILRMDASSRAPTLLARLSLFTCGWRSWIPEFSDAQVGQQFVLPFTHLVIGQFLHHSPLSEEIVAVGHSRREM